MTIADPKKLERLVQLLGMLGSDFEGERATAGRMASDIVRASGLTWRDLLSPQRQQAHQAPPPPPRPLTWREKARACQALPAEVNAWETDFLASILGSGWDTLTDRQASVLERIHSRLYGASAT